MLVIQNIELNGNSILRSAKNKSLYFFTYSNQAYDTRSLYYIIVRTSTTKILPLSYYILSQICYIVINCCYLLNLKIIINLDHLSQNMILFIQLIELCSSLDYSISGHTPNKSWLTAGVTPMPSVSITCKK